MTAPASGVSGSLPYDIDTWLPVAQSTAGIALTLPLSASDLAAGVPGRLGAGAALTAPLTAAAGAGAAGRLGVGAACTLPLTAAVATGIVVADSRAAPGDAILLAFTQVSGVGVKHINLLTASQGIYLSINPASSNAIKQGSGDPCSLALQLAVPTTLKHSAASGFDADLRILAGQGDGRRYQWTFLTPTDQDYQPFNSIYPNLLYYGIPYGKTVWQNADGTWAEMRGPNPSRLSGALRIYEGGRLHILSADDIAVLSAAGYADNIVLQEMH